MPHLEHLPGLSLVISEWIGKLYFFAASLLQLEHLQEVALQSHFPFAQPHLVHPHLLVSAFGVDFNSFANVKVISKNGTANILVTTDLASRGLDIPDIKYIIHYHLPATADIYTHRNGRTARMYAGGKTVLILSEEEKLPAYVTEKVEHITLPERIELPEKPKWSTLFIAAGKKDKVNKIDIVGFLSKIGKLKQDDIGLIEVKDFFSFAAVRKLKAGSVLELIKDEKIKNKKVKIAVAK